MYTATSRRYDRTRLDAWRTRGVSRLVTPPAVEPVDVDLLLRHSNRDENVRLDEDLMPLRIKAAREWVENYTGRALITQTWSYTVDWLHDWGGYLLLPRVPLIDVTSITVTDSANVATVLLSSAYRVEAGTEPGRIVLDIGTSSWATDPRMFSSLAIVYRAGYGTAPDSVPATFRHVVMLLAAEFSERLEAVSDLGNLAEIPLGVRMLLDPYVVIR